VRPRGTITLQGRELNTARRVLAVALISEAVSGGFGTVSGVLPSRAEVVRVLDALDWPGAPEDPVTVDSEDRWVLERVVFATLVLALEEGERTAAMALEPASEPAEIDTSGLVALERIASLAALLRAPAGESVRVGGETPAEQLGDPLISPAMSSLAGALGLPVWIADRAFKMEWVNPACAAVLGATAEEVQGSTWHRWCAPEDRDRVAQVVDGAALEQRNFTVEAAAGAPGGPYTRLLVIAAPRMCPAGRLLGWAGICFEVADGESAWVRAESLARTHGVSAARTHVLLDQLPGMIWTTDRDLRCTSSQGAGLHALELEPNQIVGLTFEEFAGVDDPEHPALRAHLAALNGQSSHYRDSHAGRAYDVYVEPLTDPRGCVTGCIGISHDVTDVVARERQHKQLLRQLNFAQSVARIGSWECDMATGEWLWSDEAYRLLGAEPGSIEPSFATFIDRVHSDDRGALAERHRDCFERGIGYEANYRLVRFDGQIQPMRGVVRFERDDEGQITRIAGILQAVSTYDDGAA